MRCMIANARNEALNLKRIGRANAAERQARPTVLGCWPVILLATPSDFPRRAAYFLRQAPQRVSGGMKVVESWRFEIPFSSAAFSSYPSR